MKRQPVPKLTLSVDAFRVESVNLDVHAIGARIKLARNALGMTQDALATLAGAPSKAGLQHNEAGRAMPGGQMIGTLVAAGVNANWLFTGEGQMLIEDMVTPAPATASSAAKINIDALEAILEGSFIAVPKMPSAQRAALCVSIYQGAMERGEITPDGVGSGNMSDAA